MPPSLAGLRSTLRHCVKWLPCGLGQFKGGLLRCLSFPISLSFGSLYLLMRFPLAKTCLFFKRQFFTSYIAHTFPLSFLFFSPPYTSFKAWLRRKIVRDWGPKKKKSIQIWIFYSFTRVIIEIYILLSEYCKDFFFSYVASDLDKIITPVSH